MTKYIIGILFRRNFTEVLMIHKLKPEWQKGLINFPGGKMELLPFTKPSIGLYDPRRETPFACASREFKEETNLDIPEKMWLHIGQIQGVDYTCEVMTALWSESFGRAKTMEKEKIEWIKVSDFSALDTVSNVLWLTEFAYNYQTSGGREVLSFGIFKYQNVQ